MTSSTKDEIILKKEKIGGLIHKMIRTAIKLE
jgi:hypothetical protein